MKGEKRKEGNLINCSLNSCHCCKGRLQYSALKAAIDEINSTLVEKYAFLHAGFGGMKSLASKKKYKVSDDIRPLGLGTLYTQYFL